MVEIIKNRIVLKASSGSETTKSDKQLNLICPQLEKEVDEREKLIELPDFTVKVSQKVSAYDCIKNRISRRKFSNESISLDEISYLLWATQGVKKKMDTRTYRNVPSACGRHPFETYIVANRISNLEKGLYRYLPSQHKLVKVYLDSEIEKNLNVCTNGQIFVGKAPSVFIWSCVPYRAEWELGISSHKVALIDVGHICQNLYIACESIELGTCAIADYHQELMDRFLSVDGIDELSVYLAPVGRY